MKERLFNLLVAIVMLPLIITATPIGKSKPKPTHPTAVLIENLIHCCKFLFFLILLGILGFVVWF